MASYKTIQYGASGSDVEDLQKRLNSYGYNLAVDGQFGDQTKNAVLDYQKKYGLTQDGIVGSQTWGKLTGGNGASAQSFTAGDVLSQRPGAYTSKYQQQVDDTLAKKPGEYTSQYQQQIDDLYNQIVNRQPFTFDLNGNALYQQYRDQYQRLGQQAMADTMGKASGLTGGYGSSYGQSVGQQAYNAYLQELNNIVPDLYAQARREYDTEGQNLRNLYAMAADREGQDYNRFMDAYNRWRQDYQMAADLENQEYSRYNDAFTRWLQLYGTLQDQENWQKEMDFQREQWEWQKAKAGGSGGSGGGYGGGGYSDGSSSGGSGGSYPSAAEAAENYRKNGTIYPGGFSDSDLVGMAESYLETGLNYDINSPEMDAWLKQFGVYGSAAEAFRAALKAAGYYKYGGALRKNQNIDVTK